jgi:hypothetical protein
MGAFRCCLKMSCFLVVMLKGDEVDFEVGNSSLHAWMRQYHGLGNVLEQIVQIELMI